MNQIRISKKKRLENNLGVGGKILTYSVYVFAALLVLVPLYIVVITSFTTTEGSWQSFRWWPGEYLSYEPYVRVFTTQITEITILQSVWNTLYMYIPSIAVGCIVATVSAFAFAKLNFRLKEFMFSVLITTMTLPNIMGQTASFLMYEQWGWIDTILPLTVPRLFGSIASVFFLRQFILGLPSDLIGAARVDGLGDFGICLRIIIPICMPAIFARFVLEFIGAYNDYMGPLLYLPSRQTLATVALVLKFYQPARMPDNPILMCCAVISSIPLLALYLLAQKYILLGMEFSSSIKG